jgi:hypothetical protein
VTTYDHTETETRMAPIAAQVGLGMRPGTTHFNLFVSFVLFCWPQHIKFRA